MNIQKCFYPFKAENGLGNSVFVSKRATWLRGEALLEFLHLIKYRPCSVPSQTCALTPWPLDVFIHEGRMISRFLLLGMLMVSAKKMIF